MILRNTMLGLLSIGLISCASQTLIWPKAIDTNGEGTIAVWVDVHDPISYVVKYTEDRLEVIIYTHKYKTGKLVQRTYILKEQAGDYLQRIGIYDLKTCSSYVDFKCSGLDGDSWKVERIENRQRISYEYWSPESQTSTEPGKVFQKFKISMQQEFQIEDLVNTFSKKLPPGKYWNYGEGIIEK